MSGLRLEEKLADQPLRHNNQQPYKELEYYRQLAAERLKLATDTGERLKIAEAQLKDLRESNYELGKRIDRLAARRYEHQARGNELQATVVALTVERDELKAKLVTQESIKRRLWELFTELSA